MKRVGNDFYIQRGETFVLDFAVTNKKGDPLMIPVIFKNPYLIITVTSARYSQNGAIRENHWLNLSERIQFLDGEKDTDKVVYEEIKKFIVTEALPVDVFDVDDILKLYRDTGISDNQQSEFGIDKFLFFTTDDTGKNIYKYVESFKQELVEGQITYTDEVWKDYDFRVLKEFVTSDWTEKDYIMDIKLVDGETLYEFVESVLKSEGNIENVTDILTDEQLSDCIDMIEDEDTRNYARRVLESGAPLMPNYNTKLVISKNMHVYVSADTQEG